MKVHITSFTCKISGYDLRLRPYHARFDVRLSNGQSYHFTLSGSDLIEQTRNDFSKRLAERARGMQ